MIIANECKILWEHTDLQVYYILKIMDVNTVHKLISHLYFGTGQDAESKVINHIFIGVCTVQTSLQLIKGMLFIYSSFMPRITSK